MTAKHYDKANKRRYQQEHRRHPERHRCACGSPATVSLGARGFVCARCAHLEEPSLWDALHRSTCGHPDSGLAVLTLALPSR